MRKNREPNSAKNTRVTEMFAAVNLGFSKNRMFNMGWSVESSHATKAPSTIAATANAARMIGSDQPCDGASMMP